EVGYYGESQPFSIGTNTNSLSLGITLQSAGTTTGDGGGDQGGTDNTAPVIETVTAVTTPTYDTTPDYTFHSTEPGTITYGNSCSSSTTSANSGNNTITFNALSDGTYYDCTIIVTDSDGNASNTITIPPFTVQITSLNTAPTVTFNPANATNGVAISGNITITFSEAVRKIDNTVLTDDDIDDHITLKYNNASGSDIDINHSINTEKTVITLDPVNNLPDSQTVYVAIGATLEDYADNPITAANATFTTAMDPSLEAYYPFNGNANDESGNS
ncbi:uncharacterized protein METZ01_LOCUS419300, partial [marine metagenome]